VIDDIGTVFEVFRTPADTVVTVVDGLVTVHQEKQGAAVDGKASASLRAGDQATIMASGAVKTRKLDNVQKAIAWTRNEIAFDGETVASVVAEFNRYNRIQIVVEDPAVAALPITGVFHTFDVQSFSQFLAGLPNVQVLETGRIVRVIGTKHEG
jgi:transmembrane sensor